MRMSCNGCRVLRKGCSDDCSIRPCLEWIKTPESQAHATVFLAKFYGRAGLMNLINAGPQHLRPAIFKSLLYESCGRIVNPIFGSVGLVWSGNWQLCQDAVEAVLKGDPIAQIATDLGQNGPPLRAGDIRHIIKDNSNDSLDGPNDQRRVRTRSRCKRSRRTRVEEEATRSPSHESSLSQQHSEMAEPVAESFGSASEPERVAVEPNLNSDIEIELDLTLGFEPIKSCDKPIDLKPSRAGEPVSEGGFWKMELGLDYSAS